MDEERPSRQHGLDRDDSLPFRSLYQRKQGPSSSKVRSKYSKPVNEEPPSMANKFGNVSGLSSSHGSSLQGSLSSVTPSEEVELRLLEDEMMTLSNDFHQGRMRAFGDQTSQVFGQLDLFRERQEKLARKHIEMDRRLNEQRDVDDVPTPESLEENYRLFGTDADHVTEVLDDLDKLSTELQKFVVHGIDAKVDSNSGS
eukprot:m.61798 g.61798  ORF g.61798 m.61798 type:complete len:199 (-) comp19300_c0_seq5:91-687(-)